jgi:ATP-binding cassette, subfamily B (MDR/TAP), member 1
MIPLFALIFGDLLNIFGAGSFSECGSDTSSPEYLDCASDALVKEVNRYCLYFLYLALGTLVASYGLVTFWMWTGTRQANRVRAKYLEAVLRQDIAFFDRDATTGKLLQSLNEETLAFQAAISEKVGTFIHNLFTFIIGMGIGRQVLVLKVLAW